VLNRYFLSFRIFEQLALALKNRDSPKFFTVLSTLLHSGFLSNLRLPRKTEFTLNIFTVLNIFFLLLRIFEQLEIALKNRVCPEYFHCIGIFFIIQDF